MSMAKSQNALDLPFDPIPADSQLSTAPLNSFVVQTWSETERHLFDACFTGNLQAVFDILDGNPEIDINSKDPDFPNPGGQTFLFAACRGNDCNPEVVKELFRRRASAKVPSLREESLPTHALVANFVDQSNPNKNPSSDQAYYFQRLWAIVTILNENAADFRSHNKFLHSPLAELSLYPAALRHPDFKKFHQLISLSSAKILDIRAVITSRNHDIRLSNLLKELSQQPKLPQILSQSVSERLWQSVPQDQWGIVIPGNTGQTVQNSHPEISKFPKVMYFNPDTLAIKFLSDSAAVSLVVCNWPRESSRFSEHPRVVWQWLPSFAPAAVSAPAVEQAQLIMERGTHIVSEGGTGDSDTTHWINIDDARIISQLHDGCSSIALGTHKYNLVKDGFVLKSEDTFFKGPLDGFRIRWVPDCKFDESENEVKFDEVEPDGFGGQGVLDDASEEVRHQLDYQANMINMAALSHQAFKEEFGAHLEVLEDVPHSLKLHHETTFVTREEMPYQPPPVPAVIPAPLDDHKHIANRKNQSIVEGSFIRIPDQFFNPGRKSAPCCVLTAKLNSERGVKFRSSNPSVVLIENDVLMRVVGSGSAVVFAYDNGDEQYLPSQEGPESQQVVVVQLLYSYRLHVYETKLSKTYPQLYSRLPKVLGSNHELEWSDDGTQVFALATAEQEAMLHRIFANIRHADAAIDQCLQKFESAFLKERNSIFQMIKDHSPQISKRAADARGDFHKNPILLEMKTYYDMLQQRIDEEHQSILKVANDFVQSQINFWMKIILDNAHVESFDIDSHITGCVQSKLHSKQWLENVHISVLCNFFHRKVMGIEDSDKQKFGRSREVFELFRKDIEGRAHQVPFKLSSLIQDFTIHFVSAKRGLEFYRESALDLLEAVRNNDVTVVATPTGSGKSTLMPLLLISSSTGICRVAVTQPRRFAAVSIYETISHYHGHCLPGFSMSGEHVNPYGNIVYITDGLLRTKLGLDHPLTMFDCVIIDEVHERSESIDTCIALLAKMKQIGLKIPKIILSSATIDLRVLQPFRISGCRIAEVQSGVKSPFSRTLHYPDTPCHKGCQLCLHLSQTIYAPNVIKYVLSQQQKIWPKSYSKDDQLLVFMPSTQDVVSMVDELAKENIRAYPLFSGQDGRQQMEFLACGLVFISTNIAETSLTFPRLKVVIDLGKVQRPRQLNKHDGSILPAPLMETLHASISTLKQRLGRVGRTCDGHYLALYPRQTLSERPEHIVAGLELNPPASLKFTLAKQLRISSDLQLHFPSGPMTINRLEESYFKFPELGSKSMADSFFNALSRNCSEDILLLAAVQMKFPPKSILNLISASKNIAPPPPKQPGIHHCYGDVSIILEIMRRINVSVPVGPKVSENHISQSITSWCGQHGLMNFKKSLTRAYFEFMKMRNHYCPARPAPGFDHRKIHPTFIRVKGKSCFDMTLPDGRVRLWNGFPFGRKNSDGSPDMHCKENYDISILTRSSNDSEVIAALAYGHPTHFFVHCSELDGPTNSYSRVTDRGDGGDSACTEMKTYYTMHSKSTLSKMKQKPVVVFALNSLMFGQEMRDIEIPFRLAVISIVQHCSIEMLPDTGDIERYVYLHPNDPSLGCMVQNLNKSRYAYLTGSPQSAIMKELALRRSLRIENEVKLIEGQCAAVLQRLFQEKSEQLKSSKSVFLPLVFLWKNLYNAILDLKFGNAAKPCIKFTGRRHYMEIFQEHISFWQRQFTMPQSVVLELPDHFTSVDRYRRASSDNFHNKDEYALFQKRLHHVTSESLSEEEIFELTHGIDATRESRMEAVCRIAVRTFDCKVVGGFVRDWIVNGERKYPPSSIAPQDWVTEYNPPLNGYIKWDFAQGLEVTPKDLDIELSMTLTFDVNRFISSVRDLGIEVDYYQHIPQRHIFLFDRKQGPFTADFIEPHFAILHTWGDFDVNCLAVSPYEDMIGLKMDYTTSAGSEYKLTVDGVISNCRQRQLVPMQDIHVGTLFDRAEKMRKRGWVILPTINYIPETKDYAASRISDYDPRFKHYAAILRKGGATLDRMYLLRNPKIDLLYDALKQRYISTTGGNINERVPFVECEGFSEHHPQFGTAVNDRDLFHGTDNDAQISICSVGFDDHYFSHSGFFGAGAVRDLLCYPLPCRRACDVLLGNIYDEYFKHPIDDRLGPEFRAPHGYDSVKGRVGSRQTEYIVYRYGQARPKYLLCFS